MRVRLVCVALLSGCAGDKDGVETADSGVDCSDPDADRYDGVPVTVGLGVGPVCGTAVVSNLVTGEVAGEFAGSAVAGADLNGDGLSDLLVLANSAEGYTEINIVLSPLGETSTIADATAVIRGADTAELSGAPVGLGPWTGDGYDDFSVTTYSEEISGPIYFGPVDVERSVLDPDAWVSGGHGYSSEGGDLDGNGAGDIFHTNLQEVDVVYNYLLVEPWSGAMEIASDTQAIVDGYDDENCGAERAWDITGDGLDDVLMECYSEGRMYLIESPITGIVSTADADATLSHPDRHIMASGAGDTDGDGYADVVVGEMADWQSADNPYGEVYLFTAPLSAELRTEDAEASWIGFDENDEHYADYLRVGATGADVNADGFADFWLQSFCPPAGYRECQHLVLSPSSGVHLVDDASWGLASAGEADSTFQSAVVGDVNGDGISDTAMGEPWYDSDSSVSWQTNEGLVWVLQGGNV